MSEVWIVSNDEGGIHGVFSTKEKAVEYMQRDPVKAREWRFHASRYAIDEEHDIRVYCEKDHVREY